MKRLGAFEQLVLFTVLRLGEDAYGVTIRETLEERTGRAYSSGAIYTALARLEERGLVSSWVPDPTPGRAGDPRSTTAWSRRARVRCCRRSDLQSVAGHADATAPTIIVRVGSGPAAFGRHVTDLTASVDSDMRLEAVQTVVQKYEQDRTAFRSSPSGSGPSWAACSCSRPPGSTP